MSIKRDEAQGLELDIDIFSDLTKAAKDRLLRKALMSEANRQKPLHRRDKEMGDPDTEEADEEMEKTVELHQNRGKPAPIPVSDEDFSEDVAATITQGAKAEKKSAKPKKG
jgi:hypothetical protein